MEFIVEMTKLGESIVRREWMLYVDNSSNEKGSGAGVILEGPNDIILEYLSLTFKQQKIKQNTKP